MARRFAIAVALLAGLAVALWVLRDRTPRAALPVVAEVERPPPRALLPGDSGAPAEPQAGVAQNEPTPAGTLGAAPHSAERPDDVFVLGMARQAYSHFGLRFVDHLASQGLPRADSEAIVAELMLAGVACALETLEEQAVVQGVPVNEIRTATEVALNAPDGLPQVGRVDVSRVFQHAMACSVTALERSGIPPATAMQLLRDEYD